MALGGVAVGGGEAAAPGASAVPVGDASAGAGVGPGASLRFHHFDFWAGGAPVGVGEVGTALGGGEYAAGALGPICAGALVGAATGDTGADGPVAGTGGLTAGVGAEEVDGGRLPGEVVGSRGTYLAQE